MKIVCDACQAKYSISDDKVQGKVFKIRCKKCSNIIVVRGGANAGDAAAAPAPEPAARVYDYNQGGDQAPADDEAVWHVVINQDQVGPMTPAEVQQRFAAGEIDAETYTWREGFADWLPLAQVDVFAEFVASGSTTSAADHGHGGGAAAVSSMFGGGDEAGTVRSDPGDLFATAGKAAAASSSADDDNDLFGSKPSAAAKDGAASAASKLRGERNENSVLFSLNNLAQLASDKPAPKAASSSTSGAAPTGHATGAAGGEGSGLIDIRSMANAYLGGGGAGMAKPATASSIGSIDDLPVFGGGGFSEPAVIVPVSNRGGGGNNKMMLALIGSVGVLAVAAVILIVVMLKGGGDKGNKVAANDADKVAAAKASEGDTKAGDDDKPKVEGDKPATPDSAGTDTKPSEGDKPVDSRPSEGDKPVDSRPSTTKPSTTKPSDKPATTSSGTRDPKPSTTKPAETKPAEPAASGGCDEVNCVLNNYEGACCAKYKKAKGGGTAAKPATSGVAESLDRTMISDGVNKVKARVMACGDKSPAKGQVKVSVKVGASGSVESVTVKTTPDAALGNCVAAAMQKATFAKTANGGSFGYPFVF